MKMASYNVQRAARFAAEKLRLFAHTVRRHPFWALACVPALAVLYVLVLIPFTPSIGDIRAAKTEAPAVVLSADGKELASFKRANREWVKLGDISPHVVAALVATEDHRFYQHHGIDLRRTAAAALRTVSGDLQGGSTITQQLARNLYPESIGRAASLTRKLKEAITALKIEAVYSKDEILESYLNTVPFLYNAHGIEMAARTYFDKSAHTLDVLESATLIGMLKGTSYYNPVLNPERAVQRRNIVLAQLVKHNKLDDQKLPALKKMPLKVDFERQTEPLGPAPHFTQQMRRWLIEWADRNDYNIYTDGLVVHTTIDARLQAAANQAVVNQGNRLQPTVDAQWRSGWNPKKDVVQAFMRESAAYRSARESGVNEADALQQLQADSTAMAKLRQSKTRLQAGFLALDPSNGHVKAWVGSRDFETDQFDHVQQAKRQPGSTFKPFVYGAAFEGGARATDVMMDQAVEIRLDQKTVWRPSDGTAPSGQPMALRDGLAYSKNTITAQLMQSVGPARVAKLARAMGVRQSKLDEVLSLALGTSPVTLKEMVSAYGSIANGGSYVAPVLVTRVTGKNGAVLEEFAAPAAEPAMSRAGADTLLDAMRGVVDKGTATGIRSRYGIQADVAGKTGTTQDNTDGWFILMHPQLVAGAWVGFNDNRVRMGDSWGQGARSALPVVGEFFQQAFKLRSIDANARFAAPRETRLLTAEVPLESEEFANAPADLPPAEWAQPSANVALPAQLPTYNATDPLPQGLSVPQNSARAQNAVAQPAPPRPDTLQPPTPGSAQPQLVYFGQPPATVIEVRPADLPQRVRPERMEPSSPAPVGTQREGRREPAPASSEALPEPAETE